MSMVLEVRELCFAYGGVSVLRGVGFSVERGDFAMLIGSNGAGKSTLLRLLLGELEPQSGEIRILGRELEKFHEWPRVGYVPQNGAILAEGFPATAAEVVSMGTYSRIGPLRISGKSRRMALEALELVDMRGYAGRQVGKMSGGQVQRVLIARALAAGGELLLLDEPVSGLDTHSAHALYELLSRLNRERGLTVIMVTHDVARAVHCATRTLCLEHGTVVELDKAQIEHEIAHRHKH